ncbi:MAG: hypothetical protein D6681_13625 [Calditrichaeota bacterium]|nr:MAG: hypothetical protein D6681_13625 [Calditrichota bacterium]
MKTKEQEIRLAPGESHTLSAGGVSFTFLEVASDSRCPRGATCVWEGDAAVVVGLHHIEISRIDTLHTTLKPHSLNWVGYTITLKQLDPYPVKGETIDPRNYVATFTVTTGKNK